MQHRFEKDLKCKKRFEIDLSIREKHGALLDAKLLAEVFLELTGGRQASLELMQNINIEKNIKSVDDKLMIDELNLAKAALTDKEKEEHKNMLKKINSPLWLK